MRADIFAWRIRADMFYEIRIHFFPLPDDPLHVGHELKLCTTYRSGSFHPLSLAYCDNSRFPISYIVISESLRCNLLHGFTPNYSTAQHQELSNSNNTSDFNKSVSQLGGCCSYSQLEVLVPQ